MINNKNRIQSMLFNRIFYTLKPLIPRSMQIYLRRQVAAYKRKKYAHIWPINPQAATPPEDWKGWPDGKKFALVLSHDVDTRKGYENCLKLADLEECMGFRSSFNFVPESYGRVSLSLLGELRGRGFDVAVHGLKHDGKLFQSRRIFNRRADRINAYFEEWQTRGFTSPSMHHNLDWLSALNIDYCTSTFDTDPFEPQPDAVETIFPISIYRNSRVCNISQLPDFFVELPYTLPQDSTLFIILQEKTIEIWKRKLDWIAEKGGMVLLNVHPDYMDFSNHRIRDLKYPIKYYADFLEYVRDQYGGYYWHRLPRNVARFWKKCREYREKSVKKTTIASQKGKKRGAVVNSNGKKIWIDLDNSPHVPFFNPIIKELKQCGHQVVVTTRDCSQTCGLADLFKLQYRRIGRHYGKKKIMKIVGTINRAFQLMRVIAKEKPDLAVSHGSRSQMLSAWILGVPFILIADYEHVRWLPFVTPSKIIVPEVIPESSIKLNSKNILKYPGIKEDVYASNLKPNSDIMEELGLKKNDLIVTIRPPATEAHYHNPESERLFKSAVELLINHPDTRLIMLPRNKSQGDALKKVYSRWLNEEIIIIPDKPVDGLNLIWHSDLVISGGGTMNREAAALKVPVYSIFRGKIGAVDRSLARNGRLAMVESIEELEGKITLKKRSRNQEQTYKNSNTIDCIVKYINEI
jgi:predicted glycosyltransferase